jgi:uncharacterized membrane protein YfcA
MIEFAVTFFAIFLLDVVYTYYLRCVANDNALGASCWSVACYILGSVAVINYTANHWLMIPAILGAFFGTLVGMKIKQKDKNQVQLNTGC